MAVVPKCCGIVLIGLYIYCLLLLTSSSIEREIYPQILSSLRNRRPIVLHSFYIRTPSKYAYRVSKHIKNNGSFTKILEFHKVVAPPSVNTYYRHRDTTWYKITTDDVKYFTKKYPELLWTIDMLGKQNCYLISKILVYTDTFRYAGDLVVVSHMFRCNKHCKIV